MQNITSHIETLAAARNYTLDEHQRACIRRLAQLAEGVLRKPLFRIRKPKGMYVWGPVGRGKRFLLDAFFDAIPIKAKQRVHFHELFRELHQKMFEREVACSSSNNPERVFTAFCPQNVPILTGGQWISLD